MKRSIEERARSMGEATANQLDYAFAQPETKGTHPRRMTPSESGKSGVFTSRTSAKL